MGKVTEKEFKSWLDSESCQPLLTEKRPGGNTIYFKMPRGDKFFYLYKQGCYAENVPNRTTAFDYTGIYSVKDGLIYDEDGEFQERYPDLVSKLTLMDMSADVTKQVKAYVENYLGNDRTKLQLKELTPKQKQKYEMFTHGVFKAKAKGFFLRGEGLQNVRYQCGYAFYTWHYDDALLDYITDREAFIKKEGEKYLSKQQENILWDFISLDAIKAELVKLEETGDTPLRRQRNIIQAMRQTEGKTVQVTVDKGSKRLAFKYDAQGLRDERNNDYSIIEIARQEREEFTKRFNGEGYFKPEEIVDISYRGKSLYSAEPYIPEQEQAPVQSM